MGKRVAVIGAGPSGLVAAKSLKEEGFIPTVFEARKGIGGQWTSQGVQEAKRRGEEVEQWSGVWEGMYTNTEKEVTRFADFEHAAEVGEQTFLAATDVHNYLLRYAKHHALDVVTNTKVVLVTESEGGFDVKHKGTKEGTDRFDKVVVCTGLYNTPFRPEEFSPFTGRLLHSFEFGGLKAHCGERILVVGSCVSGPEISAVLAADPTNHVTMLVSKPRYYLSKQRNGVPSFSKHLTHLAAELQMAYPEHAAIGLKQLVMETTGLPQSYGAPAPDDNILEARLGLQQHMLDYVAEGRLKVKVGCERVEGRTVTFKDGTSQEFDTVILCTGYRYHLPFLSEALQEKVGYSPTSLALHLRTWPTGVPNIAFVGLYPQIGPYFINIELQSRWVSYVWAGKVPLDLPPSAVHNPNHEVCHIFALVLAKAIGCDPNLSEHKDLAHALLLGPLTPPRFRLSGPGSDPSTFRGMFLRSVVLPGRPEYNLQSPLTADEASQLKALKTRSPDAIPDDVFNELLAR